MSEMQTLYVEQRRVNPPFRTQVALRVLDLLQADTNRLREDPTYLLDDVTADLQWLAIHSPDGDTRVAVQHLLNFLKLI